MGELLFSVGDKFRSSYGVCEVTAIRDSDYKPYEIVAHGGLVRCITADEAHASIYRKQRDELAVRLENIKRMIEGCQATKEPDEGDDVELIATKLWALVDEIYKEIAGGGGYKVVTGLEEK